MIKERFEKAVLLLTEFIIHRTKRIEFVVKEKTTNNFDEFMNIGKPFEISEEGNDNTIYGNRYINMLARVWHDDIHYMMKLDFGLKEETKVCKLQMNELMEWASDRNRDKQTTLDAMQLIYEDIVGQYEYYMKHSEFVPNQLKYVYNRFKKKVENEQR